MIHQFQIFSNTSTAHAVAARAARQAGTHVLRLSNSDDVDEMIRRADADGAELVLLDPREIDPWDPEGGRTRRCTQYISQQGRVRVIALGEFLH
ncbi:hypothetical protein [Bradyrhizobium elkanii]|uniref:hypothetical protein n=1 Tax=Bradyrhizobium elkanii TaxID=29448 RepID=UPI003512069E